MKANWLVLLFFVLTLGAEAAQQTNSSSGVTNSDMFSALKAKAENGDANAQENLGWMYFTGQGAPQDYAESVKWYRKAAEQGDAYAQESLGGMYERGQGVTQNFVEAAKGYTRGANQGDVN